ncbi:hypothetical protein CALVIDRAFT_539183 [Calocera viscosa TUFC12733]|uniref:Aminoglycoside phosphotransferase domain-containing protein n=1 Tax=Calocera viscosa (strain TUFC12733) TaxID=1330018 RepID=A0A167K0V1_CALVF|nr:hypothetical protein CALVIDRAFT_539183 [Calocera viscosa TUFC12733]
MATHSATFRPPIDLWKHVPFLGRLWLAVPTRIRLSLYRFIWWAADRIYPGRLRTTRVRRILPGIYLKFGQIKASEPHGMVLLRRHTNLYSSIALDYVPYDIPVENESIDHFTKAFLLMTTARGKPLCAVEHELTPDQVTTIGLELRDYLSEMHTIPNPYKYGLCSSAGGELDAPLFTMQNFDLQTFDDIRSFHAWLRERMQRHWPVMQPRVQPIFSKYDVQQTVFSHGDLSTDNIMVHDGRLAGLIDWETSGWMPAYWDYVCSRWNRSMVFQTILKLAIPEHSDKEKYEMVISAAVSQGMEPESAATFEEAPDWW